MEIITTTAITALVIGLAKKGLESASETTGEKLTEGALKWFKSLFYDKDKPKPIVDDLINNPESLARKQAVESLIKIDLEDNPSNETFLMEIFEKTKPIDNSISVTDSKNVNVGNINSGGGSIHIGDYNGRE